MILEVANIKKSYFQGPSQIMALDDVSFNLEKGKSLSIIGSSGSGKTTLLSLLAGLDSPDSGSIQIEQQNIVQLDEQQLTLFRGQNIGIVFQQFHLMPHLSALENVCLPLEIMGDPNFHQKSMEILDQVGLADRSDHFPSQLSGGECQRVAIARAAVIRPKVLLADEPSGNLDTQTGEVVMDLLFNLQKESDLTLVLVTHDNKLANRCDQQIKLSAGKLSEIN